MCLAKKYADQINEIIHKAHMDLEDFSKKQSEIDKELSQKYHEIETTNFNAADGYCLAKSLQKTLQARRRIKHETKQMSAFVMTIESNGIDKKFEKIHKNITKHEKSNMAYTENFSVSIGDVLKEKLQIS